MKRIGKKPRTKVSPPPPLTRPDEYGFPAQVRRSALNPFNRMIHRLRGVPMSEVSEALTAISGLEEGSPAWLKFRAHLGKYGVRRD